MLEPFHWLTPIGEEFRGPAPGAHARPHQELAIQRIELVRLSLGVTQADDVQRHRSQQLELRVAMHQPREVLRLRNVLLDEPGELRGAVLLEQQPHFEPAELARELGAERARIVIVGGRAALQPRPSP